MVTSEGNIGLDALQDGRKTGNLTQKAGILT